MRQWTGWALLVPAAGQDAGRIMDGVRTGAKLQQGDLQGKLTMKATLWLLLAEMLLVGGLAFLGGQLMHFGWAVFHLIVITLQAFIFMMLTIVYLSMASEHH